MQRGSSKNAPIQADRSGTEPSALPDDLPRDVGKADNLRECLVPLVNLLEHELPAVPAANLQILTRVSLQLARDILLDDAILLLELLEFLISE